MGTLDHIVAAWSESGRRLEAPGAGSHLWEAGSGDPVLCIHGVPASSYLYRKVLPALASHGLRGIAVDFPGLGLADRPRNFDFSWSGLSHWLHGATESLGLSRFHLVVHDIGGPIGFDLVRRIPDRIASLTVLNTMVRVAEFHRPWVMEPFGHRFLGEIYLGAIAPWNFELLMRRIGVLSEVPGPELRAYVPLLKYGDNGRAFLRIMRSFERTPEFEHRITRALQNRRFPAQVIWGENDLALKLEKYGKDVQEVLGLDELHRVPGKHFVQEDSPEKIAQLIASLARSAS